MKKIIYPISILSILIFIIAATPVREEVDGIHFFEGTWQEALKKSGEEHKLIFVDMSTSWCGWCKKMKQTTFADKKVGTYFNKHFINVELDGEHGEGLRLVHKFGVSEYPTLLLLDKNENALLTSEGYHDADDLINLIKTAVKEK